MTYAVSKDGTAYRLDLRQEPLEGEKHYATMVGAVAHGGVKATPIHVTRHEMFDSQEVIENNWKLKGLTPCGIVHSIKIEGIT